MYVNSLPRMREASLRSKFSCVCRRVKPSWIQSWSSRRWSWSVGVRVAESLCSDFDLVVAHHHQLLLAWRIHCCVEVTESSTNKQHTLSYFFISLVQVLQQLFMVRTFLKVNGAWLLFFVSARTSKRRSVIIRSTQGLIKHPKAPGGRRVSIGPRWASRCSYQVNSSKTHDDGPGLEGCTK